MHGIRKYGLILTTGLAVVASSGVFAIKKNRKVKKSLNESIPLAEAITKARLIVQNIQNESGCPGISIAVSVDGKLVLAQGFGYADVENGVPCSPSTVMKLASVSKPITSAILAKIWEQGGLDLDENIQKYVPYWPDKFWKGNKVTLTVRQLASHKAGVRDYKKIGKRKHYPEQSTDSHQEFAYEEYYIQERYHNVRDAVSLFKDDDLIDEPGSAFHYTTHGYTLLSAALEGVTGRDFPTLVQNFFKDLDMTGSYIDLNKQELVYDKSSHYVKGRDGILKNAAFTESSFKLAGAGMLSSATDLLKFANVLLYSFQQPSCQGNSSSQAQQHLPGYLNPETVTMLWKPVHETHVSWHPGGRYGMGWQIVPLNGNKDLQHGVIGMQVPAKGNDDGLKTSNKLVKFPNEERVVVGHTGGTVGASCAMIILPEQSSRDHVKNLRVEPHGRLKGVAVVILANLQGLNLGPVATNIAQVFDMCTL